MDPNKYFRGHNLKNTCKKENKVWICAKKCAIWTGLHYITVDFKKLVKELFHSGSALRMCQEKNWAIRIAPKHNSLETFPYAIQKHLAMYQSGFTL